nr:hypothetical protein QIA45_04355 [Borreliella andersonii]
MCYYISYKPPQNIEWG